MTGAKTCPIMGGMSLAKRLKQARELRGMSQTDLDRAAGVATGTACSLEAGRRKNLTIAKLRALAEACAVSPSWLIEDGPALPDDPTEAA